VSKIKYVYEHPESTTVPASLRVTIGNLVRNSNKNKAKQ